MVIDSAGECECIGEPNSLSGIPSEVDIPLLESQQGNSAN